MSITNGEMMLACNWDGGKAVGSKGELTSLATTGDAFQSLANGVLHFTFKLITFLQ